jgi:hypothetical protein
MASITFPWNTVNTLARDAIAPNLRVQVYQSNAFLKRLDARKKMFSGGRTLQQPIVWRTEGQGQWFSGADILDTSITDTIQMAVTVPKSFAIKCAITWDDEKTVQGPAQVLSLVETKGEQCLETARHLIATDLFNDGTDALRMTGLQYIFKDFTGAAPGVLPAQTYLGITRQGRYDGSGGGTQTNNWWCHQGDDTTYVDTASGNFDPLIVATIQGVLGKMWAQIGLSAGSYKLPTLILSNWGSYTCYHNSFIPVERYVRPQMDGKMAADGFENVKYKQAIWLVDEKAPRSAAKVEKIYLVNEDSLRLFVHEDANFSFEPFRKPHNQMARVAYYLWRGELLCIEPRCNGVISSVSTATYS